MEEEDILCRSQMIREQVEMMMTTKMDKDGTYLLLRCLSVYHQAECHKFLVMNFYYYNNLFYEYKA